MKPDLQTEMNSNDSGDHTKPASSTRDANQPERWLLVLSPFLKQVNMRTLALLMFVGFAVLNTTRGNDAQIKEPSFAGTNNVKIVDNNHDEGAQIATEPTRYTISASPILWQFVTSTINALKSALNDQSLIDYAKQQGLDTSGLLTTPCPNASSQSPSSSEQPATQSSKPLAD